MYIRHCIFTYLYKILRNITATTIMGFRLFEASKNTEEYQIPVKSFCISNVNFQSLNELHTERCNTPILISNSRFHTFSNLHQNRKNCLK